MFDLTLSLLVGCMVASTPTPQLPLKVVPMATLPVDLAEDQQIWQKTGSLKGDYQALLKAIDHSLQYLDTDKAEHDYQAYGMPGITRSRVIRSLRRFRQLVVGLSLLKL